MLDLPEVVFTAVAKPYRKIFKEMRDVLVTRTDVIGVWLSLEFFIDQPPGAKTENKDILADVVVLCESYKPEEILRDDRVIVTLTNHASEDLTILVEKEKGREREVVNIGYRLCGVDHTVFEIEAKASL